MIPRISTTHHYGKHSIRYIGPVIWSKLSKHIKSSVMLASFKNQVRKVDIESLLRTDKVCKNCHLCVTLRIINGAGQGFRVC